MLFYSTQNKNLRFTLKEAVMKGLPDDRGLFMPVSFPAFRSGFPENARDMPFGDIAFETAATLLGDSLEPHVLRRITDQAITFDAPLVKITDRIYALELFHGPTLAFKDFGARFMAGLMEEFNKSENSKLTILVATSGDTGGAVASGFAGREGIEVIVLYPKGKVSPLQEKQLTTPGGNITALAVDGTFDDCQRLVKTAFPDKEIGNSYRLTSANSINIARLIPQSFYYVYACSRLSRKDIPVVFSVPSGNFGNLTAGLFAWKMGLPVRHFIAATNSNDSVPQYLISGRYEPRPSVHTLSNAMDVGDPSNFSRITDLFNSDPALMKEMMSGYAVDDATTAATMRLLKERFNYQADPHGAVAYRALEEYLKRNQNETGIFLETAHPAKFLEVVEEVTGERIGLPSELLKLQNKTGFSLPMSKNFSDFKEFLMVRNR